MLHKIILKKTYWRLSSKRMCERYNLLPYPPSDGTGLGLDSASCIFMRSLRVAYGNEGKVGLADKAGLSGYRKSF